MRQIVCTMMLLGVLAIPATSSGEAVGNLAGVMLDSRGNPVPNGVVVMQTSDGLHPYATHTDSKGHFEFIRYSTGQYDLRGSLYGVFTEWSRRILIRANKTTEITLRLPAAVK